MHEGAVRELALFAGAGGGLLASRILGWRTVCAVEIDEHCQRVLMQRQDDGCFEPFPIWPDVRTFDGRPWRGSVDLVSAGFPCQPHSTASRGRAVALDLFHEVERIVGEVRPRFVILENVVDRAYPPQCRPYLHPCCPAGMGAAAHRERSWLVAYADDEEQPGFSLDAEMARLQAAGAALWMLPPVDLLLGMDDGMADRMDRLRAVGNGQVPVVAATAWAQGMNR